MSENINFNKQSYDKRQYSKIIDTSFNQLGVQTVQQQLEQQPTVSDFFTLYNELFYQIPELGVTDSHEYLVKTSGEYISFNANQDEIIALQNEIAQLRVDLLDAQKQIVNLQISSSNLI